MKIPVTGHRILNQVLFYKKLIYQTAASIKLYPFIWRCFQTSLPLNDFECLEHFGISEICSHHYTIHHRKWILMIKGKVYQWILGIDMQNSWLSVHQMTNLRHQFSAWCLVLNRIHKLLEQVHQCYLYS